MEKQKRTKSLAMLMVLVLILGLLPMQAMAVEPGMELETKGAYIVYAGHVESIGDQAAVSDGDICGTEGRSLRVESLTIEKGEALADVEGDITYRVHVQNIGTTDWMSGGKRAGTTGQGLRMEAVQIALTEELEQSYDVYYSAHVQNIGWTKWTKGTKERSGWCGSMGQGLRIEAVKIKLVEKGAPIPDGSGSQSFVSYDSLGDVQYMTHQQNIGNHAWVSNQAESGVTGRSLRLEAMRIRLSDMVYPGSVQYRSHVQNIGWTDWVADGDVSGTSGQGLRMEAVQIQLAGDVANYCDIWYRVHVQDIGWLGWAVNGQSAGTEGLGYRVESLQVVLVPKGMNGPGTNVDYFRTMTEAELRVYNSVQYVYSVAGRDLYACYNWVVKNVSYRSPVPLDMPPGYSKEQWYAIQAFENRSGNCYCYAAAFYWLAKYLGYNARYVEGKVSMRAGGFGPHGWVEIDGKYICDPEAQHDIGRYNFYMQPINRPVLQYRW